MSPLTEEKSRRNPHQVLLVSDDSGLQEELGGWLEAAGFTVMTCPGPRFSRCVGLRRESCALESGAGLVVLDLHPEGSDLIDQTLRPELVKHYQHLGHHMMVVADESGAEAVDPRGAAVCERAGSRGDFLAAVRSL